MIDRFGLSWCSRSLACSIHVFFEFFIVFDLILLLYFQSPILYFQLAPLYWQGFQLRYYIWYWAYYFQDFKWFFLRISLSILNSSFTSCMSYLFLSAFWILFELS
jgi:hypothetical protein